MLFAFQAILSSNWGLTGALLCARLPPTIEETRRTRKGPGRRGRQGIEKMRVFNPASGQLLFHYCSAQALMAILGSRTIRLSDINMMNDAAEFRWGYSVFEQAATRLLKRQDIPDDTPPMPKEFFDAVDEVVDKTQLFAHPFVACFSFDGDSLEQWRAYGDDGRGFAIGLSAERLALIPLTLFEVLYDVEQQINEVVGLLRVLFEEYESSTKSHDFAEFRALCGELGVMFAGYKHPAFRTEREVRCVHAVQLEKTPKGGRRFRDPGGQRAGVEEEGQRVSFHVRDGHLTAHIDLPFLVDGVSPVEAVITGPKNLTVTGNLLLYLASEGLDDLKFGHSRIPYR